MNTDQLANHVIPGAGKSTLSDQLLNGLRERNIASKIVPMDGFHLDNTVLNQRSLLDRKGAPETFDAAGFVDLVKRLSEAGGDINFPKFDRQKDASIANADTVYANDRILIFEGNYLLLKDPIWTDLQKYWNATLLLNPGIATLERRLVQRWLDHGLNKDAARQRALHNDIPNAHYVLENSIPAEIQIDT